MKHQDGPRVVDVIAGTRATRRRVVEVAALGGMGLAAGALPLGRLAPVAAQAERPLIIGRNLDDVMTLDPHVALEETFSIVLRSCYDTLISTEPDDPSTLVPALAEEWSVSDDASTYTFTLKEGVTFASGNPVTAADVKFSYDRLREMTSQASYLMDPVATVEAADPRTVIITLESADAVFIQSLTATSFGVVDAAVVKEHGGTDQPDGSGIDGATEWLTQNSAGSGPYVLTGYTPKDRITMERNPSSWRSAEIDEVIIQAAPDTSALKQMLERGDVDIAWGLLTEQLTSLQDNPDIEIASTSMLGFLALVMTADPTNNEAVAKPEVRQAIKYALDSDGIRTLREGALTPPSLVPIGLPGALDPAEEGFTRDVELAKQMLGDAGYPDGFDAVLSVSGSEILGGVQDSVLAEKVQADLAEVGINVTLDVQDEGIFRPKYRAGDIELAISGWYVGYPNPFDLLDNWGPLAEVSQNRLRWNAPDHPSIALLDEARGTVDAETRDELVRQAQRELLEDAPYTILVQPVFSYAYRATLSGVEANPMWNVDPSTVSRTAD